MEPADRHGLQIKPFSHRVAEATQLSFLSTVDFNTISHFCPDKLKSCTPHLFTTVQSYPILARDGHVITMTPFSLLLTKNYKIPKRRELSHSCKYWEQKKISKIINVRLGEACVSSSSASFCCVWNKSLQCEHEAQRVSNRQAECQSP